MLSPGPSTAAAGTSNSSSSDPSAGDLPQSPHPPPPNMASALAFPLVDISENVPDSTDHPLSSSPPKSFVKSPSASLSFSSPPLSKSTSPQISKPPLPAQQPSALPKSTSSPLPRPPPPPAVRALSPPQSRPPPPVSVTNKPGHPNISIMEKLIKTCPVWLQLGMRKDKAMDLLSKEPPGIFIIRKDCSEKQMILSVRLPDQQGEPNVNELPVKEEKSFLYLEGSVLVFENIFKLVAFYCVSRDILPFPLRLPQVILQVIKYEDMEVISSLGSEFWSSALNIHDNVENDHQGQSSCEIQLSTSSGRLWNVNPVFIEECSNSSPPTSSTQVLRTQSLNSPIQSPPKYKRPPPLRPRPPSAPECLHPALAKTQKGEFKTDLSSPPSTIPKEEGSDSVFAVSDQEKQGTLAQGIENDKPAISQLPCAEGKKLKYPAPESRVPPVPVRRKLSDKQHSEDATPQEVTTTEAEDCVSQVPFASLVCLDDSMEEQEKPLESQASRLQNVPEESSAVPNGSPLRSQTTEAQTKKHSAPAVPPRRKRQSQNLNGKPIQSFCNLLTSTNESTSASSLNPSSPRAIRHPVFSNVGHPKALDISLYSPEGGAPQAEHDSYSTSSTEEEADLATGGGMKRTSIIMLDRAKQRLSMVSMANFSNVITGFMSTERKLQKRIVELARDGNTYFGNLVKDYRTFTLETMRKHISSTEMLQEIRQMMTQLKSYLIQSAELENLQEAATYSEEKLEVIVEAAICKSVLKPLREHVYSGLRDIHSRLGNIKKLKENQQVVLNSTTTDLGVITSVPETAVMEKIQAKLSILHQEYSPQKKIDLLLKTCKTIYDSMSVGSPGKAFGADDFLPVLMYVLARSNITALLLDVEYMMELMDPALQLGEGSYYLTTTYGALEHIKNFDKQPVTKQLSLEIQDSIHRWERRRTLNKARASRSSLQDFINVSFLEAGSNTKTLGVRPGTTAQNLSRECAEKFEVLDPDSYCLSLLVEGHYKPLGPEEFPLIIKTELHHSNPRKDYYFVYRHGRWPDLQDETLSPSAAEESLI